MKPPARESEAQRRRREDEMREAAIRALGWEPEVPGCYLTGDNYAATTGELVRWAAEIQLPVVHDDRD